MPNDLRCGCEVLDAVRPLCSSGRRSVEKETQRGRVFFSRWKLERADLHDVFARRPQRGTARGEKSEIGIFEKLVDKKSSVRLHVFAIVEKDEHWRAGCPDAERIERLVPDLSSHEGSEVIVGARPDQRDRYGTGGEVGFDRGHDLFGESGFPDAARSSERDHRANSEKVHDASVFVVAPDEARSCSHICIMTRPSLTSNFQATWELAAERPGATFQRGYRRSSGGHSEGGEHDPARDGRA